jgi:DNA-binding MarR family transcriptional regulator
VASARQATPTLSDAEAHAWFGLLLAHGALARQVDAVSALAEIVVIGPSRVSRVVDDLVGRGLVERRRDGSDARVSYATVTDDGRRRAAEVEETFHAVLRRRFLDRLDAAEVERLAAIWDKLGFASPPACDTD